MGAPAENIQVTADPPAWFHPGRGGTLRLGPTVLGAFGELHPAVLEALDARPPIAGFEVFLDAVPAAARRRVQSRRLRLSVFQPIERDFAFVVDRDLPAETLLRAARGVDRKLVSEIRLFDVYEGTGLPEGKKSLAITVVLQPQERTLTEAEIEGFSKRLDRASRKGDRRPVASVTKPSRAMVAQTLGFILLIAVVLFGAAGRIHIPLFWAYLGILAAVSTPASF